MYFLVDYLHKVIFGWSAKCGCSHIKNIFWFFQNIKKNDLHEGSDHCLPNMENIKNYTTIIFSRNPYKRIVSGFLDKYRVGGEFRKLWKDENITFSNFVDTLEKKKWEEINFHHFTPQTTENFDEEKLYKSKCLKIYDLENIDYKFIEDLFNKKIPIKILTTKFGHERSKRAIINKKSINNYVYNLNMIEYINNNVDINYFYNKELKKKIFDFYKKDFIFFKQNGIDYINTII